MSQLFCLYCPADGDTPLDMLRHLAEVHNRPTKKARLAEHTRSEGEPILRGRSVPFQSPLLAQATQEQASRRPGDGHHTLRLLYLPRVRQPASARRAPHLAQAAD